MVGTLVHGLLEIWAQQKDTSRVRWIDAITGNELEGFDKEKDEARRIFTGYVKAVGTSVGWSEWALEESLEDTSGVFGVDRLTARVDGVATWAGGMLGDLYLNPGRYLWEHKTAGKRSEHLEKEHMVQIQVNCELWNKQHPDKKVLGGLLNNIVKTKEIVVQRLFVPLMDDVGRENLTKTLSFVYMIHEQYGDQMVATKETCAKLDHYNHKPCWFYDRCWK
jgi:hypothetical protein